MNRLLVGILCFGAGVACGILSTNERFKKKYSDIADDEIAMIRQKYFNKMYYSGDNSDDVFIPDCEKDKSKTESIIFSNNYKSEDIFVISPDEFGEEEDFERISLTYYADGVLTDDNDEIVEDVDDAVGSDFEEHFGEYEDDSVYVRNKKRKVDFEILLDVRNYSDIVENKPNHLEG